MEQQLVTEAPRPLADSLAHDEPAELISEETALPVDTRQLGLWAFLATVTMLFAGFTSAILVRRASTDWQPIPLPGLLWMNTAVLLLSSFTIERARALLGKERGREARAWLSITAALGLLFLFGQFGVWRHLVSLGVYLPSSPHSSFFYILTGAHAVHLLGGVLAMLYLLARVLLSASAPVRSSVINLCATYWHFVDGLWIYLFVVLFVL